MTPFDLLFILVFLASVFSLLAIIANALFGRLRQAAKLFVVYLLVLLGYLGIVVLVSLTSPPRTLALGENRCFDDWCIAVETITPTDLGYTVTLRLSNKARRVSQRENGVVVYVLDENGRYFDPLPDTTATPFNVLLAPSQTLTTTRRFDLTEAVRPLVLVVGHDSATRFPGMFIIGDDSSLFHQPTIVRLP